MDFDPVLLRAFVAVKEAGGFTRAAQRLHLTQSAVSHQIRRLEEQIGRPLLSRTTRTLTLTEDGNDFLRHAEQILASLDALNHRFRPSAISGVVRFGYQRRLWASDCHYSYLNLPVSFLRCDLT
jgi:DNA-binding transcriptional LysR family regulator